MPSWFRWVAWGAAAGFLLWFLGYEVIVSDDAVTDAHIDAYRDVALAGFSFGGALAGGIFFYLYRFAEQFDGVKRPGPEFRVREKVRER